MTKTFYDTPPGQDNSLIAEITPGVRVHKHAGSLFLRGAGFNTKALDRILSDIKEDRLVFFAFTGPPGSGKTFFALRLAELLDKHFQITDSPAPDPKTDTGQVAFERDHLNYLLGADSSLKHYQCVVIDESHFGLGSRSWQQNVQQSIVNLLVACRAKRIIFMVVALNMTQIDKYIRDFVINFQFTLEDRGRATLYRRYFHKLSGDPLVNRLGAWTLPLPGVENCPNPDCLGCEYLYENKNKENKRCGNLRAKYERRKLEFLDTVSIVNMEQTEKESKPSLGEIAMQLQPYVNEIPWRNYNGGPAVFRGQLKGFIEKKLDYRLSSHNVTEIAGIIERSEYWKKRAEALREATS